MFKSTLSVLALLPWVGIGLALNYGHASPYGRRERHAQTGRSWGNHLVLNSTHLEARSSAVMSPARLTFFVDGLGACGKTNGPNDFIVALNSQQFDNGAHCFESITITVNGKTAQAQIVDECPGCPKFGLDLSEGLFKNFADESVGVLTGSWVFNDGSSGGGSSSSSSSTPQSSHSATHSSTHSSTQSPTQSSTTPSSTSERPSASTVQSSSNTPPPQPASTTSTPVQADSPSVITSIVASSTVSNAVIILNATATGVSSLSNSPSAASSALSGYSAAIINEAPTPSVSSASTSPFVSASASAPAAASAGWSLSAPARSSILLIAGWMLWIL